MAFWGAVIELRIRNMARIKNVLFFRVINHDVGEEFLVLMDKKKQPLV